MNPILKYLVFLLLGIFSNTLISQSTWSQFLGANGGIRTGFAFYKNNNGSDLTSPLSYYISGSANVKIGSIDLPFSITYRDHNYSFSRPYIHMGVSPTFKSTTFHIGYRNMTFSPYTLSGITFLGAGFESNPGKLRLAGMYGRFQNPYAQRDTIVFGSEQIPTYNRKGYAGKIGYGSNKNHVDLIYFRAYDDINSIDTELQPSAYDLRPQDNVGIGLNVQFRLSKRVDFKINSAASIFTNDANFDKITLDEEWEKKLNSFFNLNGSTRVSYAGDASININFNKYRTSFKYKRIAPFFNSLGSYFLQNDIEEYTFQLSGMISKPLRFNSTVGIQRNNLDNRRSAKMNRLIVSANIRYNPKGPFNASVQYNNFDITNQPTVIEENDSLKLVRVMRQIRVSPSYRIKGKNMDHNIGLAISRRGVSTTIFNTDRVTGNNYIALRYNTKYKPLNISFGGNLSYNKSELISSNRGRLGGNLNSRKQFMNKKLNLGINLGYYENSIDGKKEGNTLRSMLTSSYQIRKKQRINISVGYSSRSSSIGNKFNNIRGRVDYSLSL